MEFGICSYQTLCWQTCFCSPAAPCVDVLWAHLQRRSGWGRGTTHLNFRSYYKPVRSGEFGEVVLSNSQEQNTTVDAYGRLNLLKLRDGSGHACMQLSWINVPPYPFSWNTILTNRNASRLYSEKPLLPHTHALAKKKKNQSDKAYGLRFYGSESSTHQHLWSQTDVANTLMSQDGDTQFTAKKLSVRIRWNGPVLIGHPDLQLSCKMSHSFPNGP